MRISFSREFSASSLNSSSLALLLELLAEKGSLKAVVSRVSGNALVLKIGEKEVDLSLPADQQVALFAPGTTVEVFRRAGNSVLLQTSAPSLESEDDFYIAHKLQQVLLDLNIQPRPKVVAVAEALLKNGFPLREKLIHTLLPWAKQGYLHEAILLLKAGFPLTEELIEMVDKLAENPVFTDAGSFLSAELKELLDYPRWQSWGLLGKKCAGSPVEESLSSLFAQELMAEFLLNPHSFAHFVFALPFLLGGDLCAAWVRITPEDGGSSLEKAKGAGNFTVLFKIPTKTLGEVGGKLTVHNKKVGIVLCTAEKRGRVVLKEALTPLRQKLSEFGWNPMELEVVAKTEEWMKWK